MPESEPLCLELDKLCDGLEHGALDCQLFQLAPDLRRAALKLVLKTKQGDAKALKSLVMKASRERRQDLKKLKALEDPVWKQKLRKVLKVQSRRQALQSLVPKTGLSAAQKKAAAKAKAKANAAAKAKAKAMRKAISNGQAQPLQPLQSPSKKLKTGLLAISMALKLKCSKKKMAQAAPALPPEKSKKAKSAPAPPGEPPPGQPQGPLQGKLLRVTSEKLG